MSLAGNVSIPSLSGPLSINFKAGSSIVFIGSNGTGKTHLDVFLDTQLSQQGIDVHRIATHRSLTLKSEIVPLSLEIAQNRLFRSGNTFEGSPETLLLSDFNHIMSALYAENNDVSIKYKENSLANGDNIISSNFLKIKRIFEKLLSPKNLIIIEGNLKIATETGDEYSVSEMSDEERMVFYLIAQALLAKPNALLIVIEPALHIGRSISAKLWDEIESSRPDCCFLYITHDIEFAGSRHAATRYALWDFQKSPTVAWDIELIPKESEFSEDIVATIIESRKPVLFVEGIEGSLGSELYRQFYDQFTVIPVGSCDQVIHAVYSFAARLELHRIGCAGIIGTDGRTDHEAQYLESKGIYRLPVSEVENLLLLPRVFLALAHEMKFTESDAQAILTQLQAVVLSEASWQIDAICLRYTKRCLDAEMKKIGLTRNDRIGMGADVRNAPRNVNQIMIFNTAKADLSLAISSNDYEKVLSVYNNKSLLSEAIKLLGLQKKYLDELIGHMLRSNDNSLLYSALKYYLPNVIPKTYF